MALDWHCDPIEEVLHLRVVGDWPADEECASAAVDMAFARGWYPGVRVLLDLREAHGQPPPLTALTKQWQSWMDLLGSPGGVSILTTAGPPQVTADALTRVYLGWNVQAHIDADEDAARAWLKGRGSAVPPTWGTSRTF